MTFKFPLYATFYPVAVNASSIYHLPSFNNTTISIFALHTLTTSIMCKFPRASLQNLKLTCAQQTTTDIKIIIQPPVTAHKAGQMAVDLFKEDMVDRREEAKRVLEVQRYILLLIKLYDYTNEKFRHMVKIHYDQ